MRLLDVRLEQREGRPRLSGVMEDAAGKKLPDVWYEYDADYADFLCPDAEAFIPVMLVASMLRGEDLRSDPAVSAQMAGELHEIQEIFKAWYGDRVSVVETDFDCIKPKDAASGRTVGAFFSGGVDSFYTALTERWGRRRGIGPVTHLVYMEGLETPLREMVPGKDAVIRKIGAMLDFEIVAGITNLRDCFDFDYRLFVLGPALAGIAHSLAGGFRSVLIPSSGSYVYEDLFPAATHVILDPLWSSERMKIRQDGCDATRAEKMERAIAGSDVALKYLTACTVNRGEFGNCGVCPKCVRTVIALEALGILGKCEMFASPFRYGLIRTQELKNELVRSYFIDNLDLARRAGADARLVRALARHLWRYEKYTAFAALVKDTVFHPPARRLREFVKRRLGR